MVQMEVSFYCAELKGEFPLDWDTMRLLGLKTYQATGAVATAAIANKVAVS